MTNIDPEQRIYAVLAAIPSGVVVTYGQVAELAGLPRAARLVGRTLRHLPSDSTLPWHRVINAAGKISLPPDSDSVQRQIARLKQEGLVVDGCRISLAKYRWRP
ncbi:MGMT family protein [Porticoccaceae bacterium]|nr:MGMT family protein [Porticoccaceae bacterium]